MSNAQCYAKNQQEILSIWLDGASSLARFALAYIREEKICCYDAHRRPKIQACKE